eukprot:TRINITY_DN2128_c1_g1_i1.p2 TRINITY_DN2128_c1_g1~~TRINITY_DN2128_c1_g1_i1.p2  ORF type:complete len:363 (+),score=125.60 TRINITY_DN2128_c1_g1_i1:1726-2814(+)
MDASTPLLIPTASRGARLVPVAVAPAGTGDVELGDGTARQPLPQGGAGGGNAAVARQVEINILGEGVQGITTTRYLMILTAIVNIPQIIGGAFVLAAHWRDDAACDAEHRARWRVWSVLELAIIAGHTAIRAATWRAGEARADVSHALATAKNALEALGLIWFVAGNLWLFGGQDEGCEDASASAIYQLCLVLIVVLYVQICLPCLLAVLMVPVLCFCLPCVVRVLSYFHDPMAGRGASQRAIDALPIVKYGDTSAAAGGGAAAAAAAAAAGALPSGAALETACPICLNDYAVGDELRQLPCAHALHRACLDSWLAISATCPNCRASIRRSEAPPPPLQQQQRRQQQGARGAPLPAGVLDVA